MTNSWRALARMARDRIVQANPEDVTLVLDARTPSPSSSLTSNLLTTILVPPPLLPRPPAPLQPSFGRSDERLQRARGARACPPLRARRHPCACQGLGRRCARSARLAPIARCGLSAARVGLIAASHFIEIKFSPLLPPPFFSSLGRLSNNMP